MTFFTKKRLTLSLLTLFIFVGLFSLLPKSLESYTDFLPISYFQCSTHGFQQTQNCGSTTNYFPRTDYTAAAISYQFQGHRHGGSSINATVCLLYPTGGGDCRYHTCSGYQCGHEYGGQHPFNLLSEGSFILPASGGSSGFYMYRSAIVEDAEVRVYASASADYPNPTFPEETPESTTSSVMVNFNFVVKNQYDSPIQFSTVTISTDFGNGTTRSTDGNGFANFGVLWNTNVAYTVTASGCAVVSGVSNSGPGGINIPVTLICSGATPQNSGDAPLILCTDPTATNNGLAAPCLYSPPPTACLDNSIAVVTQPLPERMSPNQTASYTIRVTNTGETWWADGTYYQFLKKSGNLNISPLFGGLPTDKYPGQFVDWTFNVTAPATLGSYVANMQMIHKTGYPYKLSDGSICAPSPSSDTYFGQGASAFTNVANCPLPTSESRGVPCSLEPGYGPGWRGNIFETRVKDPVSCNWGSWQRPLGTASWCTRYYALNVTKAGTGTGTVTSNPTGISCGTNCTEHYVTGSTVTLTAVANSGSSFAGWSGNADCSDGSVSVNADKTCTATFNANPAATTPDIRLNVPTWGYANWNNSIDLPSGVNYSVSWGAVANAVSCTLDGSPASVSGATISQSPTSLPTKTHTLTCLNSVGQSNSDSITITIPPPPTSFSHTCSADGTQATLNWTLPPGYTTGAWVRWNSWDTPPFHINDITSGLTRTVAVTPGTTYGGVYILTRGSNGSWSAPASSVLSITCMADTPPTLGSITISPSSVYPNNSTTHTITVSGSDVGGASKVDRLLVLINHLGTNAGQYRGYLTWNTGATATGAPAETKVCGGGGIGSVQNTYGPSYIHIDSCSVSDSGNTRTVSFNVRFTTLFTAPLANNDLAGLVYDDTGNSNSAGWTSRASFGLVFPDLNPADPTPITATAGTPVSFSSVISNIGNTSTGIAFNNIFWVSTKESGHLPGEASIISVNSRSALGAGASGSVSSSAYTFASAGDYYIRSCADKDASMATPADIFESNETNNCSNSDNVGGAWTKVTVAPANAVPVVNLPTATSITATGATLGANVVSLGTPASISARGTCWGTTPAPATNCLPASGLSTGVFTHSRSGMNPNTTHYYRGYATNAAGTGYSVDGTFTTLVAPVAGVCGSANKNYPPGSTTYGSDTFCSAGTASPASPVFPTVGNPRTWTCLGLNGGTNSPICTATLINATHALNVNVTTAGGTVISSPPGINCDSSGFNCSYTYGEGEVVVLTATPKSSYWKFVGWGGDCSGSIPQCNLVVNSVKNVTATFALRTFNYQEF